MSTLTILLIYDSIANSVFESQVLQPALRTHQPHQLHIISFEIQDQSSLVAKLCAKFPGLTISIVRRWKYIGSISLWLAAKKITPLLDRYSHYTIKARGPYAGQIALHFHADNRCKKIVVQCRGLIAEEYLFGRAAHALHRLRAGQLKNLEKKVFTAVHDKYHIEAVSPALAQYLVTAYGTDIKNISIAQNDIPEALSPTERGAWRTQLRRELCIPEHALVICYSGSCKPWQCFPESVVYAHDYIDYHKDAYFLILTPDRKEALRMIHAHKIPEKRIRILNVEPDAVLHYLTVADTGLMLRTPHLVNWVSRPTKALEYQAAGLSVIHNHTVAYLRTEALIEIPRL